MLRASLGSIRRCVARVGVAAIFRLGLKILALHLLLPSQPYTGTTAVFVDDFDAGALQHCLDCSERRMPPPYPGLDVGDQLEQRGGLSINSCRKEVRASAALIATINRGHESSC